MLYYLEMLLQSTDRTPLEAWEIRCYLRHSGKNDFVKWHAGLSKRAQVKLRTALQYLRYQPATRWTRPDAVALGDHVCVIHFSDENRTQHRVTGFHDVTNHVFVMCVIGFEKDGTYTPADYENQTRECRLEVNGRLSERTCEWPWSIH